jgi:hypothetical protein
VDEPANACESPDELARDKECNACQQPSSRCREVTPEEQNRCPHSRNAMHGKKPKDGIAPQLQRAEIVLEDGDNEKVPRTEQGIEDSKQVAKQFAETTDTAAVGAIYSFTAF